MIAVVRWTATFLLLVGVGVAIWLTSKQSLPDWLVSVKLGDSLSESFFFDFFGFPAFMIVAGIAGFVRVSGFWLWGIALVLPVPVIDTIQSRSLIEQGLMERSDLTGVALSPC